MKGWRSAARRLTPACLLMAAALSAPLSQAAEVRVATWNLGWHLDQAQAQRWIAACDAPFTLDPVDRRWKPALTGAAATDARPGWSLPWRRDAPIEWNLNERPPCDVFRDNFKVVPVTQTSYAKRSQQATRVLERIAADVIAFQEVSGSAAVREVLPDGGRDYQVCSYEGYGVQRLAFAWKKSKVTQAGPCEVNDALSLPHRGPTERPRPGLAVMLTIDGQRVRFLNVHLKSACFSPLESNLPDGRGQLAGSNPACATLQAQLEPLEAWLQAQSAGTDHLVLLGDLNRNLSHEHRRPAGEAIRIPAGDPRGPYQPGVRSSSLWREVNDADPPSSALRLLEIGCPLPAPVAGLCEAAAERLLSKEETRALADRQALGCRNPIGLDHIAISARLRATGAASKFPLGVLGATRRAVPPDRPDPLLAVSDHCPLVAVIGW